MQYCKIFIKLKIILLFAITDESFFDAFFMYLIVKRKMNIFV